MVKLNLGVLILSSSLLHVNAAFGCNPTSVMQTQRTSRPTDQILFAGFGGGGASTKKGKKGKGKPSITPLKPKKQWDYYTSDTLKASTRTAVGVRLLVEEGSDEDNSWLTVGYVKSIEDKFTKYAVLRQRALIAEHAKRLFPLKVSKNARIEWGYVVEEDDNIEWMQLATKEFDDLEVPKGGEKSVGFEGFCDASTGFYCQYHEGKLVSESLSAASSKYV